jgi:hypothetical protein
MYAYADNLIAWKEDRLARFMAAQLKPINEVLARGIEYELMWNKGDYEEAFELFSKHDQWPDRTYKQQALALVENGKFHEAETVAAKITDANLRVSTLARMLFDKKSWKMLAALKPQNDEQRKWQLMGLAKQNPTSAGRQMDKIKDQVKLEIPQLTLLVKYYGRINNDVMVTKYAKRLSHLIESETKRLDKLTNDAIKDKVPVRAKRLLSKLVSINPDAADIQEYQKAIVGLEAKVDQPPSKT